MVSVMSATTPPGARLLGPLLVGFVAGAALQLQQRGLWDAGLYAGMVVAAVAAAGLVAVATSPAKAAWSARTLATLVLALVAGFALTGLRAAVFQAGALAPALEGKDIEVTGRVPAMPQRGDDGLRFRLAVESARLDGTPVVLPAQLYLGWYAGFGSRDAADADSLEGPAALLALQRQPQNLRAGETWRMTVRLKAPHGNSNPHGFDYELWLWEQGLQATGYVRAGPRDVPPQRLADGWRHPVERARQWMRDAVYARVSDRQLAGVVAALLVGDQNAIERADWDVFRATGVAHLMSISGLHITM